MWSIFFFLNARQKLSDILLLIFSNIFPFFVIEIITRPHLKKQNADLLNINTFFFFYNDKNRKRLPFLFSQKQLFFLKIYICYIYIYII